MLLVGLLVVMVVTAGTGRQQRRRWQTVRTWDGVWDEATDTCTV
ncbi:MAG: hypothetical protein R2838_16650 [Caldilineaceae bacterium]